MTAWTMRRGKPSARASAVVQMRRDRLYDGELILVNKDHPVRRPAQQIVPVPDGILQASRREEPGILLERTCLALLSALLEACGGRTSIAVVSGYRSRAAQERLYATSLRENGADFTAKYVALPGASEHETGLAVDVGLYEGNVDYIRPAFPDRGACGVFKRLAAKYGFVQRYRADKTDRTGIACEPWHFRYVGYPHSVIMEREGLCLEEYTEFLKQYACGETHLYAGEGASLAEIYYVRAEEGDTPVPLPRASGARWRLSGNNKDGFVVTVYDPEGCDRHV
ncbi:D-alanyl-D-alanine carboxypeptidase family protein [Cohnella thermotolerans]|jgi:D-alanyl-D-alanine dipeptidase/carboxypeptidase|uniref:D-alanyl-D-alanine carboxypeptidase family protein n=1 Tax=Cohnella thermotolerans TaxID=329858 RepID=UPI0004054612|nr:D-alanyl-D-alanine carboxypeptidase family protein [Cohnella thermotolerans]